MRADGRIIIKQRSNIPLVTIAIAARGGSHNESAATAGLTGLAARVSVKGTAARRAADIAITAENMGGSISPSVSADLLDWEITVPARHFERALELLADVAFNAAFPEKEFDVERKLALSDLKQTRDDMYRYPLRLCLQQAFAGHPYGNTLAAVEASLAAATPGHAREWYQQRVRAEPWVFVVGDVDPDAAAQLIERVLPGSLQPKSSAPSAAGWKGGTDIVETRDKAQTALAIGFPGPRRDHHDSFALQVLANAVGGLGGRFFEELRSKRSLAYTVTVLPIARWLAGMFIGYIATSPEREDEARAALFEEFERLRNERIDEADLERSKRYTIGTWQIRSQTNGAQLGDLMHACVLGEGVREIEEFERRIQAVSADDIMRAAQTYFDPAAAVQGTVRGKGGKT
jgi:zinc protease